MNEILLVQEGKSVSYEGKRKGGILQMSPRPQTLQASAPTMGCSHLRLQGRTQTKKLPSTW